MNKILITHLMTLLTCSGCGNGQTEAYPSDTIATRDGTSVTFTFFKHASLALEVDAKHIYIDPVTPYARYSELPKADLVLVTHSHYDHLDKEAIDTLSTPGTLILCDSTSAKTLDGNSRAMRPGDIVHPLEGIVIEAVAAYNTSPDRLQFHPKEREDCGYILTVGGTRIYIAGDTEPTPELLALRDIDIAFLPVNQPYTMTVDQAVEAVKAIRPAIFYPYHYGQTDEKTDIDRLVRALDGVTEVRVRPME